jgi:3-oxoacyl-[acyl-carrier protein] reductase
MGMAERPPKRPLDGQVALVTGAALRIGRGTAVALARAGAHVVVNYRTSRKDALEAVEEIKGFGVDAIALRADVSIPREVRAMFQAAQRRFRRLDLLVNNAAIFYSVPWQRLAARDWDRILGINLKGTFFCAQAAARIMMGQKRGQIINISSLGGLQAWPDSMHYCCSKAAVIMLTKCLAKALAPHIRVNSIAPGTILFPGEERDPRMMKRVRRAPLQIPGQAGDIADLVVFLATRNRFITGQVIAVDGGKSVH